MSGGRVRMIAGQVVADEKMPILSELSSPHSSALHATLAVSSSLRASSTAAVPSFQKAGFARARWLSTKRQQQQAHAKTKREHPLFAFLNFLHVIDPVPDMCGKEWSRVITLFCSVSLVRKHITSANTRPFGLFAFVSKEVEQEGLRLGLRDVYL